jgi:hypothetical protein
MVQPAEQEMFDAAAYYEMQVAGLGQDFLVKVASAVADIAENPERWPVFRLNVRRRLVHRFPYGGSCRTPCVARLRRSPRGVL